MKLRVKAGGHDVDDKKIEQRYYRSLRLFSEAAPLAYTAFLIDNSKNYELMAELRNGKEVHISPDYPDWLKDYYKPKR